MPAPVTYIRNMYTPLQAGDWHQQTRNKPTTDKKFSERETREGGYQTITQWCKCAEKIRNKTANMDTQQNVENLASFLMQMSISQLQRSCRLPLTYRRKQPLVNFLPHKEEEAEAGQDFLYFKQKRKLGGKKGAKKLDNNNKIRKAFNWNLHIFLTDDRWRGDD